MAEDPRVFIPKGARTAGPAPAAPAPDIPTATRPSWFTRYKRGRAFPYFGGRSAQFADWLMRKRIDAEKAGGDPKGTRAPARSGLRVIPRLARGGARQLLSSPAGWVTAGALMPSNVDPRFVLDRQNWLNSYLTFDPDEGQYADVPGYGVTPEQMYQGAEVPAYDEDFLNNLRQQQELQGAIRERDEAELAAADPSDLSMRQAVGRWAGNSWDNIKAALAGESTPTTIAAPVVYDISKMAGKKADAIATGTTTVNNQKMVTRTDGMWDRIMMLMGDTGGGIDWKDAEKTHSMLLAGGILSGQGGGIANSFFSNVMGMARMQNDQKWRVSQLATMPRKTYYPIAYEGNAIRLDPTKDILNLHPLDDIPPMYSESKPGESMTNSKIIESKEGRKRLDGPGGLRALWDFKIQTYDKTGMGDDWFGMGVEIASIYTNKYPKLIDMKVMPPISNLNAMIKALKGRTAEAAIAAGDLEDENWDNWLSIYGNWLPHPSMLGLTAADFDY